MNNKDQRMNRDVWALYGVALFAAAAAFRFTLDGDALPAFGAGFVFVVSAIHAMGRELPTEKADEGEDT